MKITVICANDSLELAFPPGTCKDIIEEYKLKVKQKLNEQYPNNNIYVHTHDVDFLEIKNETITTTTKPEETD